MGSSPATLPVIPLPKDTVLFPGTTIQIPISNAKVTAVFSKLYGEGSVGSTHDEDDSFQVVCVPLRSPLLNQQGQKLILQDGEVERFADRQDFHGSGGGKEGLFAYGVAGRVRSVVETASGPTTLTVEGLSRVRIVRYTQEDPYLRAEVVYEHDVLSSDDIAIQNLFSRLKEVSLELVTILRLSSLIKHSSGPLGISPIVARRLERSIAKQNIEDAGLLADSMINILNVTFEERLQALLATDVESRMKLVIELLLKHTNKIKNYINFTIITTTNTSRNMGVDRSTRAMRSVPKPYFPPLGVGGPSGPQEEDFEMQVLKDKIAAAKLTPEAAIVADREMKRLSNMSPMQAEYQVIRNYLETLAEIPWSACTEDRLDVDSLARARRQLDEDHYGLEKVKKRLLEYLAVLKLKQSFNEDVNKQVVEAEQGKDGKRVESLKKQIRVDKSPILLLLGPPGVGKTSLAKSLAHALGRKYHRIALGGVRDEAEIRGHRRTYVASMPGNLINGLKKVGVNNPVFLLDELDKLSTSSVHGDPSAAMLEVLDPEQNNTFTDHYINIPFDLSKVLFIATANSLDNIAPALMDRLEIITLPGYTTVEKRHIAMRHLIPKQIRTNGLAEGQVVLPQDVVCKIIDSYTRESGVRSLEREIGSVCRAKAVQFAEATDAGHLDENYNSSVALPDLEGILGVEKFEVEVTAEHNRPGIVTGLVAYSTGSSGSILFIEVADMPGKGKVRLTGKLGDVLKESVEVALSWVRGHAFELGLTADIEKDIVHGRDVHVHCPSGSVPKDGPSAGVAHAIALISLFSARAVPPTVAMTGEISLRGRITQVGGIKEKLIGALRAGVKTVLLPTPNRKDIKDLPPEVKDGLEIIHVGHIWEAIKLVWPSAHWPGEQPLAGIESQL